MKIAKNMLIEWIPEDGAGEDAPKRVERVLTSLNDGETVVVIDIFDKNAFPSLISVDDIMTALEAGDLLILTYDPLSEVV